MGKILKDAVSHNTPFWVLTVASLVLMLMGFLLPWPPTGNIDGTVIAGVGEFIGLGALWVVVKAIDKGVDTTVEHNGTKVTVSNDNQQDE